VAVDDAFVTEQLAAIGVAQDRVDRRRLAVDRHNVAHQPDAVAVVDVKVAVADVEGLDRFGI
jgi:hypothetical protein